MNVLEMTVPYPPSINHYWRHTARVIKGRVMRQIYISAEGQAFRKAIKTQMLLSRVPSLVEGNLFIDVFLYPPDKRKRDIDNPIKGLLDALQHAGVYVDDNQITRLYIEKCEPKKPHGEARIRLGVRTPGSMGVQEYGSTGV